MAPAGPPARTPTAAPTPARPPTMAPPDFLDLRSGRGLLSRWARNRECRCCAQRQDKHRRSRDRTYKINGCVSHCSNAPSFVAARRNQPQFERSDNKDVNRGIATPLIVKIQSKYRWILTRSRGDAYCQTSAWRRFLLCSRIIRVRVAGFIFDRPERSKRWFVRNFKEQAATGCGAMGNGDR